MRNKFEYEEFSCIEKKNLSSISSADLCDIASHAVAYCCNCRDNNKDLDMPSPQSWDDLGRLMVELCDRIRWLK